MSKIKVDEKVKPFGAYLLVTTKTGHEESQSGLILPEHAKSKLMEDIQEVVAVGDGCSFVEVGDVVKIKMGELLVPEMRMVGKTKSEHDQQQVMEMVLDKNKKFIIDDVEYMMVAEHNLAYKILK